MKTKWTRSLPALLLSASLLLSTAACSGGNSAGTPATSAAPSASAQPVESSAPRTVVDALGREVEIPEKLDRLAITCNGGSHQELTILGASDRIVAMPNTKKFPQLQAMFPAYKNVVDAGSFDDVNVEEMIKADPDFIFVGQSSKEGNAKLEEAGFPTYTMLIGWADIDTLKQEFLNVGAILGDEDTAKALVAYWDEKIAMVEDAVAKVPEAERKVVYYTGKEITKANSSGWTWPLIETSGAISALPEGAKGDVNVEDVITWNPDVIIVQGGTDTSALLGDNRIQEVSAIASKEVYQCPIGAFWWDRPSPESPLAFMWLAKTLYPEYTKDIDLKTETKQFFSQFYHYDLSDAEYESFFFQ